MYLLIGALAGLGLFIAVRFYLLRHEIKRLHRQIDEMNENARYGKRMYLEENDNVLANTIGAINRMVDNYERKLRRVSEMEQNIRQSISGITHDIRTPLTSLTGYLQLLSKEASPDKQREYLDTIFNSVGMLRDLTENFYELARLDLEEDTFSIQNLNLEHIAGECFLSFYENFAQKNIELNIEDAKIPPIVLADTVSLRRVLCNIIQNLLRYAKETVSVSFSEEDGYFAVTIGNETDSLIPDDINRVFERFYTADPSRSNQSMGLGLYISQKLIAGMGGSIVAYKENLKFYVMVKLPKSIQIS